MSNDNQEKIRQELEEKIAAAAKVGLIGTAAKALAVCCIANNLPIDIVLPVVISLAKKEIMFPSEQENT